MDYKGGGKPTLFSPSVVEQKWMTKQEKKQIQTMSALDYIMNFISKQINVKGKHMGDKILILKSGTGSGKSTSIAPTLFDRYHSKLGRNIIITQPRILTAIDIPNEIVKYYSTMKLGINIGFQTGILKRKPLKGIIFSTVGTLLQQFKSMKTEQIINKYSVIIIDEVHDRSIEVESVLYYLKKLLEDNFKNERCPIVILMSATFDSKFFMNYFDTKNYIEVEGLTYPIQENYLEFQKDNYINYVIWLVEKIHIENIEDCMGDNIVRDILIFVDSTSDIKKIVKLLDNFNKILDQKWDNIKKYWSNKIKGGNNDKRYFIAPISLNSDIYKRGSQDYQNLFSNLNNIKIDIGNKKIIPSRRVIVSTNIAETGVTIETLKYCIDTGWVLNLEFNPDFGVDILYRSPITQGMSNQRKGRVGRKAPGIWYSCYKKETYNLLLEDQYPNIIKEDLTNTLLGVIIKETETELENSKESDGFLYYSWDNTYMKLYQNKQFNAATLDFMEPPSSSSMKYSFEKLYKLGFIDNNYNPTIFGYYGNLIRKISLESIRMIFAGYFYGSNILDLITIACFLSIKSQNVFDKKYKERNPLNKKNPSMYNKLLFADELIEYIFIWNDFIIQLNKGSKDISKDLNIWCQKEGLILKGLLEVAELRDEIIESMISINLNPYYNGLNIKSGTYNLNEYVKHDIDEIIKIKKCIYEGYRLNIATWDNKINSYVLYRNKQSINLKSNLIKPLADGSQPKVIIIATIIVMKSFFDPKMYVYTGSNISILDGYVDIDLF